mmetsp:Transcript_11252/g.12701  ORF Transcript_11252/g.12701 Transcript_11252/m.12701 type:complete len:152 (-) Transcript_11252:306-761(-)
MSLPRMHDSALFRLLFGHPSHLLGRHTYSLALSTCSPHLRSLKVLRTDRLPAWLHNPHDRWALHYLRYISDGILTSGAIMRLEEKVFTGKDFEAVGTVHKEKFVVVRSAQQGMEEVVRGKAESMGWNGVYLPIVRGGEVEEVLRFMRDGLE